MLLSESERGVIPASFSIRFTPSAKLVVVVRRFVLSFYTRVLEDMEVSSQLALATHELLENAVKYGTTNDAVLGVSVVAVAEGRDGYDIDVSVRNSASAEHLAEAKRVIDAIDARDDTFAYYQEQMLVASEREMGSGLGLARIAAEAGMRLSVEIEDDELEIRARAHFTPDLS